MAHTSKPLVLVLCTGNACRSQMAEAMLRHHAGDRFEARSAGLDPTDIPPLTLSVLRERHIDTAELRPKSVGQFLGKLTVRYAIVVCERAQQSCPHIYPFCQQRLYWPFEDPAAYEGTDAQRLEKFRAVRDQIESRILRWLSTECES